MEDNYPFFLDVINVHVIYKNDKSFRTYCKNRWDGRQRELLAHCREGTLRRFFYGWLREMEAPGENLVVAFMRHFGYITKGSHYVVL